LLSSLRFTRCRLGRAAGDPGLNLTNLAQSGAERAAEAKLGLSIVAINWPAQFFKVGTPLIRDLPNPLAGEGYIASLEYAAFDFAPFEICRTEDCKVTRDFGR
jgi:hypothetical protein